LISAPPPDSSVPSSSMHRHNTGFWRRTANTTPVQPIHTCINLFFNNNSVNVQVPRRTRPSQLADFVPGVKPTVNNWSLLLWWKSLQKFRTFGSFLRYLNASIIAASLLSRLRPKSKGNQNTISGTSGHRTSTPMIAFHSQGMTSYWCSAVTLGLNGIAVEIFSAYT